MPAHRRRLPFFLTAGLAAALAVPVAASGSWPNQGGDAGRSGLQPVDEGYPPVVGLFAKTEPTEVKPANSPVITSRSAEDGFARVAFGTDDGTVDTGNVHLQVVAEGGDAIFVEAGVSVDDGANDADTFRGTAGAGPLKGQGVAFASSSTSSGLGQLYVVHNDDNQNGTVQDIAIARIDEATGQPQAGLDFPVTGTDGFTISASPVLSEPRESGDRDLYFVAFKPCPTVPATTACQPMTSNETRLFRAPISNPGSASAGYGTVKSVVVDGGNRFAPPTLVGLPDSAGNAVEHVAVGAIGSASVRTFTANDLVAGPVSGDLGDTGMAVSAPVASNGTPTTMSTQLFVAVGQATDTNTIVYRLSRAPGSTSLATADTSNTIGGTPAAALSVARRADGGEGRVLVTTGKNFAALDTGNLKNGVKLRFTDDLAAGTTGFSQTTASAMGDHAYVARDNGEQLVLRIVDAQPIPAASNGFTQDAGNNGSASASGQPAISDRAIVYGSDKGVFGYRAVSASPQSVPALTVAPVSVPEGSGAGTLTMTVTLARATQDVVRVKYATFDGTATAGSDYSGVSGQLEFAPGDRAKQIAIPVSGDNVDEDNEAFTLVLSEPQNAYLETTGGAAGTIVDDDDALLTVDDATANEGDSGVANFELPVRLSGPSSKGIKVRIATADDTASGGVDYDPILTEVDFAPGETVKTVPIPIHGDRSDEPNERFLVDLAPVTASQVAKGQAFVTIADDDDRVAPDRRRSPDAISVALHPLRDARRPYIFTVRGRLLLPRGVTRGRGCRGRVTMTMTNGKRVLTRRSGNVKRKSCRFAVRLRLRRLPKGVKARALRIETVFQGNATLKPIKAPALIARLD